jgi:tRNA pseudouridine38-40 synthase
MPRYFLEVAYKGTNYSGFQIQQNANSIQQEVEDAFKVIQKARTEFTGSSRTDAGVHALQNFFHFDFEGTIDSRLVYKMNAILPDDIAVVRLIPVNAAAHCRFDAASREYKYFIYRHKDPFLRDRACYFPYKLNLQSMQQAADIIRSYQDFTSFSKRKTQAKSFICEIEESKWEWEGDCLVYYVKANRFLRGMVRALVATMLQVGRDKMTVDVFKKVIEEKNCAKARFGAPPHGLFLIAVNYPEKYFSLT